MKPISLLGLPIRLADATNPLSQNQARIAGEQAADYWQKVTQGKLQASSSAAPVYVSKDVRPTGAAAKLPDGRCNTRAWTFCNDALKAARAAGFNGTTPVYYPPSISCQGHGVASYAGPVYMIGGTAGVQMLSHEVGHTLLGDRHSWGMHMTKAIPFDPGSPFCKTVNYGDPYDVMGTGLSWLNPNNAQRLGVRPAPKRIPRTTRTMFIKQTGQLNDLGAPRAVQITRGGPPGYTYQATYQSPTNLNQNPVKERVVILRLVSGLVSYYLTGLKLGQVWLDPIGGVSFEFRLETPDGCATVEMVAS